MKRSYLLAAYLVIALTNLVHAQYNCATMPSSISTSDRGIIEKTASPLPIGASCNKNSTSYLDYFRKPDNYMPYNYYRYNTSPTAYYPNREEPTKTVVINIVFFGEDDGTGFPYTPTTYSADSSSIDYQLNDIIKHPAQPGCGPIHPIYFNDAGLTFKIHKVYFYKNSAILHANDIGFQPFTNAQSAMNYHLAQNPDAENQINCILTQNCGYPGAMGFADIMTYQGKTIPYIASGSNFTQQYYATGWQGDYLYFKYHLPHEIGHHLDLLHLYQNQEHSIFNGARPWDYLDDVFPTAPPQSSFLGCNNLMRAGNSGATDGNAISPIQTGRMHRSLSTDLGLWNGNVARHYAYGFSEIPYTLEVDETWDFTYKSYQDIIIPSGKTLTIRCQLEMVPNSKIIVKPGGQLIVDGGLITAARCGGKEYEGYWQGIIVEGKFNKPQLEADQGKVVLKNGAIIEFAREAIMPWVYNDWSKTGGIILATDATFRNNKRSVQYMEYHNYSNPGSTFENANRGRFINCSFIWDNDCLEVINRPAVTLNNVKGVKFEGCTFHDKRTNISNFERANGILSIDAGYSVLGKANAIINPPHTEYNETNYDVGEFIDLFRGIEIQGSGSYYSNIVDHVKFTNCAMGVYVVGSDNPILTRNKFDYAGTLPAGFGSATGMKLQNATGFKIEGNHFMNTKGHSTVYALGCVVHSSGNANNSVYKNKYDKNKIANQGILFNRNIDPTIISGLEYKCNNKTGSFVDFSIDNYNDHSGGIKLTQGSPTTASQNLLTVSPNRHIITRDSTNYMNYYWKLANNKPTSITGSVVPGNNVVIVTESLQSNSCNSSFTNVVIGTEKLLANSKKTQLEQERLTLISELNAIENPYFEHLNEGDAATLHNQISTISLSTRLSVKNSLLAKSPYLSVSILTELGGVSETLFSKTWFKEIIKANIEAYEVYEFRLFLMTKAEPFVSADMSELYNHYLNSKTARFSERNTISSIASKIADLDNWLLADALVNQDENVSSQTSTWIQARNNTTRNAELMDYYFGTQNWPAYTNAKQSLQNQLINMPDSRLKSELADLITIQDYHKAQLNPNGQFDLPLSTSQIEDLLAYRQELTGRARVYASNLLCFWADICEEQVITDPFVDNSSRKSTVLIDSSNPITEAEFMIVPNPNTGTFHITFETDEIESIEILDIHGKKTSFAIDKTSAMSAHISMVEAQNGLYIIQVRLQTGKITTARIIKN